MKPDTYCYKCGWIGTVEELDTVQVDTIDEDGAYINSPCCPCCGSLEDILPIEYKEA